MSIIYALEQPTVHNSDLKEWVETSFPHLTAAKIFQVGTKRPVIFENSGLDESSAYADAVILDLNIEWLQMMENIVASIRKFNFHVSGTLKKYNTTEKVFIVDLLHRVGEDLTAFETVEALSVLSFTLNDDNTLSLKPNSLGDACASVYSGTDEWMEQKWDNIAHQSAFSQFCEQFEGKGAYEEIDVESFLITKIHDLYNKAIKNNIAKVCKQAESVALIQ